jgi:hypothetical protein
VLDKPVEELVKDVQSGGTQPIDILRAYGKAALKAHEKTNCVTEVMFTGAEGWLKNGSINLKGPLAGIPVSLKDSIGVGGRIRFPCWKRNPHRWRFGAPAERCRCHPIRQDESANHPFEFREHERALGAHDQPT